MDQSPQIDALLTRAARRLVLLKTLQVATWGALVGLTVAVILVVVHRLIAPPWELTIPVTGSLIGFPLLAALVTFMLAKRDSFRAALALEQHYALHERLSSILFLRKEPVCDESATALIRDGERHVEKINLDKALPLPRPRGVWATAGLCLLFTGLICFLPQFDLLGAAEKRTDDEEHREAVEVRKKELAKRIREIRKKAEQKRVSTETKELLKKLAERQELQKKEGSRTKQRRQALVDLDKMRDQLKKQLGRSEMKGLEKFMKRMREQSGMKLENTEMKDVAKALEQGDLERASALMKKLAKDIKAAQQKSKSGLSTKLDEEALASLMRDMEKLAPALENLPGLQEKLSKGLQGMSAKDLADLAKDAGMDLEQLARLLEEQELLDQALEEISFTEEELASLPQEWPDETELCEECRKAGAKPGGM